jgi:hypothetical protein
MMDVAIPQLRKASHYAADKAIKAAKTESRAIIRGVGLGRLANAIGSTSSLAKERTSGNAWGAIFARGGIDSRANQALMAYTQGASIVPTGGRKWLAFPTKAAGRLVRLPIPRVGGRGYANFKNQPNRYGMQLRFVKFSQTHAALVLDQGIVSNKTGRVRRGAKRAGAASSHQHFIVMFWLIPFTRRAARFDQHEIVRRNAQQIGTYIEEYGRKNRV